jgi:multidrug transporter EmrE-like cation transporter
MLGGMVLPFFQGIIFYGEKLTLDKIICVIFIVAALLITLDFKNGNATKKDKFAPLYYIGIFVFNGMSGVLSKIFASSTLDKTTSAGYSIWLALISTVVSAIILFTVFRKRTEGEPPLSFKLGLLSGSSGALNKIANYILVVALASGIDASIQYPMVTGGVMIVSTACAYLTDNKPKAKELISVGLAFIGMLALFVIPMLIK